MKDRKKIETKMGLTAQSTAKQKAKIDRDRCYNKRQSPNLSKMVSDRIDSRTYVYAKNKKLLTKTIELIQNRQQ